MHITFAPRGILQIDDAKLIYRNFEGRGDAYNREGDRNFALVIEDQETADRLIADGWNVKSKPARNEGEEPRMHLPVKIKFTEYGPNAYLDNGRKTVELTEDTISCLDRVRILKADLDIRPYDWELPNGKHGRSAYLQGIHVTQEIDRFAARREDDEY